jgi:hypothetical protein
MLKSSIWRWIALTLLVLTTPLTFARSALANERDDIDISVFYDELEGRGRWFRHDVYGEVWKPDVADDEGWRPYTRGRWANTEENGWTWVSDEPWGWAVYHYGRWTRDEELGWVWVPGTKWGPAWVAWREGDETIGWAPLPPEAEWAPRGGLSLSTSFYDDRRYEPYWTFIGFRHLMAPHVYRHVHRQRGHDHTNHMRATRPITNYTFIGQNIVNHGVAPRRLESALGRPIVQSRMVVTSDPNARSAPGRGVGPAANSFRVYRPQPGPAPKPVNPSQSQSPPRSPVVGMPPHREPGNIVGRPNPASQPAQNAPPTNHDGRRNRDHSAPAQPAPTPIGSPVARTPPLAPAAAPTPPPPQSAPPAPRVQTQQTAQPPPQRQVRPPTPTTAPTAPPVQQPAAAPQRGQPHADKPHQAQTLPATPPTKPPVNPSVKPPGTPDDAAVARPGVFPAPR